MPENIIKIEQFKDVENLINENKVFNADIIVAFETIRNFFLNKSQFEEFIDSALLNLSETSFQFNFEDYKKSFRNELTSFGKIKEEQFNEKEYTTKDVLLMIDIVERNLQRYDIFIAKPKSKIVIEFTKTKNEFDLTKSVLINILNKFKEWLAFPNKINNIDGITVIIHPSKRFANILQFRIDLIKESSITIGFENS
ncbi:MAG: hypothetical protein K9H41_05905 [Bacteroidia bacterium]|nr:hypothetical protein [Bacteroidia bacterium]